MAQVADRVKETSTSTGTGNVALAGAVAQFRTFNSGIGIGQFFYYVIEDADGVDWETGRGYLSDATTLVRYSVQKSSNSNNPINLSAGTHTVFCTIVEDAWKDLTGKIAAAARGFDMP